jgi:hypothetical protein
MPIDQIEYAFAASFNFGLQSAHNQKVIAGQSEVKAKELRSELKKCGRDTVTFRVNSEVGCE